MQLSASPLKYELIARDQQTFCGGGGLAPQRDESLYSIHIEETESNRKGQRSQKELLGFRTMMAEIKYSVKSIRLSC